MHSTNHRWAAIAILSVICFAILYSIYGKVLIHPNQYMLSDEGEAMRSYYVMASHLENDSSWIEFKGMNYPYGEHLSYCDGQPLTTFLIKGTAKLFPSLKNKGVGYINILSLYSLILGAVLLFLAFTELRLPFVYAALTAIALMMLSPQVVRMKWQPALGMACYIPSVFFFVVYALKRKQLKWELLLGVNAVLWYFMHPYLGLMQSVFILLVYGTMFILNRPVRSAKDLLKGAVLSIIPAILFLGFMQLTDQHTQRVESPQGLIRFSSYIDSVFLSVYSPFSEYYYSWFNLTKADLIEHMEAWAYIGVAATLFLFFLVMRLLFVSIAKGKRTSDTTLVIRILFIVSSVLLIISFAFPFKWFPGTESWLEYIPPLRQFRSLGRFSWFFVYALYAYIAFWISQAVQRTETIWLKNTYRGLFVLIMGVGIWEGAFLHEYAAEEIRHENQLLDKNILSEVQKGAVESIVPEEYQAIVPIPYFHIGSHAFKPKSNPSNKFRGQTMVFAQHTNLPLTSSFFSRNSRWESIRSFRFFADAMFEKKISEDFNSKPLLIYYDKNFKVSEEEMRIVKKGDTLYENENLLVLRLEPDDVFDYSPNEYLQLFKRYREAYEQQGGIYVNKGGRAVKIDFNEQPNKGYLKGGMKLPVREKNIFLDIDGQCCDFPEDLYKVSFWFNHTNNRTHVKLMIDVTDRVTGKPIETISADWATRTYNISEEWMLCEFDLYIDPAKNYSLYFVPASDIQLDDLYIDELMIRSIPSSVYEEVETNKWFWNNRPLYHEKTKGISN